MTDTETPRRQPVQRDRARRDWWAPVVLIAIAFVPVVAGSARLAELSTGAEVTPGNARFHADPVPVVAHIISATIFCVLGAFQFVGSIRRRRPGWHRIAGRILVPCGLVAALSGLWMTVAYPRPPADGELVVAFRLLFGSAMVVFLVLGFLAVLRRDFVHHRAWMMRGYAVGLAAGTQAFTHLPWLLLVGQPTEVPRALLMAAGWVINLAVAEWIIRRSR